jgi:uncharacterized protein
MVNTPLVNTPLVNRLAKDFRRIAVVGLSNNPSRPSYRVAKYLQEHGFKITPVNPGQQHILGETCYPSLSSIPFDVDLVNLFQRSENVPPFVDEAINIGAKAIWMQLDIVEKNSAQKAVEAGLEVVMDRCIKIDYQQRLIAQHLQLSFC